MSFFQKKVFLVLDIGTEGVKTLIFQNNLNQILGTSASYFDQLGIVGRRGSLGPASSFEIAVLKKTLTKAIAEVQSQAKIKAREVLLGLPANVFRGRVVFQSFKRKNVKKIIGEKERKEIHQRVLEEAKEKTFQDFSRRLGILPEELEILNLKILATEIDGYEISDLRGYWGRNLEFQVFISFSPRDYLKKFKKIVQDLNLKIKAILHPTENLLKTFPEINRALLLDIGGEVSQLILIKDGKIQMIEEFESGGKDFSQALSRALGLNEERARFLKERYSQGFLSGGTRRKIKEIFSNQLENWFDGLKLKLKPSFSLLPSLIFLFGGGSLLPEIKEILEEGNWQEFSFLGQREVKFIYPKQLKTGLGADQFLPPPLNTPQGSGLILIASAFLEREGFLRNNRE